VLFVGFCKDKNVIHVNGYYSAVNEWFENRIHK